MISFFRNFFQSKIGLPIFLLFLAVVALAFAASDLTGSATFGGIGNSERVALIGDDEITSNELASTAQSALSQVRRENPTVTMPVFIADGGLEEVLDQLIDRYAIGAYAELYGLRAGDNLVNSEILQLAAFKGANGEFSQEVYQEALRRQSITDAILRRDLSDGLLAQQVLLPALSAPQMPGKMARQYAALLLERREGDIGLIPSAIFVSDEEPAAADVEAYYTENRSDYILPERRSLRYAIFSAENLDVDLTPTDEEIAARYEDNKAQYEARESRDVTSFFVPTQEGAQAIVEQIRAGKSLEAAAQEAGFNTTSVKDRDREQYASTTSFDVAEAVFKAGAGQVADPAQSTLGWYVARVDNVTKTPAKSLSEVRSEIAAALTVQKRAAALADLSSRIEEEVDGGTALTEIAETFSLNLETSPPLLADGRVFNDLQSQPNPALRPILDTAFELDESQPQLDELVPGAQYMVYDVTDVVESAAPPLKDIRERIVQDLKTKNAAKLAQEAAQRIVEKTRAGTSLADAISAEEVSLPRPDQVALTRRELQRQPGQNPPPSLVLLFSMAKGTVKLLEAPANQGWIIVGLNEIESETLEDDNPILARAKEQLAPVIGSEYTAQLTRAMRTAVGVDRNDAAVEAVKQRLSGDTN